MSRILLVEDNFSISDLYKEILEEAGYEVVTASEGNSAKELIMTSDWDLLLLDIMLPQLDGLSILKEIKADTKISERPVLIISNIVEKQLKNDCLKLGVNDYIVKSEMFPNEIVTKVESCLPPESNE